MASSRHIIQALAHARAFSLSLDFYPVLCYHYRNVSVFRITMEAAMAKAKSTTVTKSYEGDVSAGGEVWALLGELAVFAALVGIGWFVFG